jgi:hypothetical protein
VVVAVVVAAVEVDVVAAVAAAVRVAAAVDRAAGVVVPVVVADPEEAAGVGKGRAGAAVAMDAATVAAISSRAMVAPT